MSAFFGSVFATLAMIWTHEHPDLPADVQRAREPRGDGARARRPETGRARGARDRRLLARRDRRDRGSARGGAPLGARPAPGAKGGARPRVPGWITPGTCAGSRARIRDRMRIIAPTSLHS